MSDQLVIPIDKIVGHAGKRRDFDSQRSVSLRLGDSVIEGPMTVAGTLVGTVDGVTSRFSVRALATLVCTRCLKEWPEEVVAEGTQHFRVEPDEDGYQIVDGSVDVGGPAKDELALAIPAAPVCREGCLGLCPTCGTDLNEEPCDGHGDESDSPFAILKDLFDS